ncbi:Pimeloyl-ACP methyl ester carboxylesterase [Allopseudospirillum japonicum]|uniref:Pimeloyl-ACP methyl ester carboxylesterase n=1 Tax=Allopseudospirillum japonicum TaxID=64971 RepID=A0A1H6RSR3_9GAMM|nr:alpha/beta hydrolase [Allopseudospirillum japonicum]SEI54585.1 Pimeloyl-ACP methyl ester carboxylesterase [Allopseudospirillum japonicum]
MTPALHFAHANGFPGASYQSLFTHLAPDYQLHWIDQVGHAKPAQIAPNWQGLCQEVLDSVTHLYQKQHQAVWGVGHSLGGVLTYMAMLEQPHLFKGIILLDPPLMLGIDAYLIKLAKRLGWIDRLTPAAKTQGRRTVWPSTEAMYQHLHKKALFRHFHPQALADYIQAGTQPNPQGGIRLRFQPEVELAIFRHLADHLQGTHKRLACPVAVIAGQNSDVVTPRRFRQFQAAGFCMSQIAGDHMFPFQYPQATAAAIHAQIQAWQRLDIRESS